MSPQAGYRAIYIDGHNDGWKTLHLAHFQSRPRHYAAIRGYSPSVVAAVAEDDKFTFGDYSPELAARVRDELDELAVAMCTSQFQQGRYTPAQIYDQVIDGVKAGYTQVSWTLAMLR